MKLVYRRTGQKLLSSAGIFYSLNTLEKFVKGHGGGKLVVYKLSLIHI